MDPPACSCPTMEWEVPEGNREMITLVPIDGSQSSEEAVKFAVRRQPQGELLLLYVAPSARQGDLERGRFLLEAGVRHCRSLVDDIAVTTRLEVGDRRTKVRDVAAEANCGLVVMSAHGEADLPHVDRVSSEAAILSTQLQRPVLLVLPTGKGIRGDEELAEDLEEALMGTAA